MLSRPAPASLKWLLGLVALATATAMACGAALYVETRHVARTQAEAITGGSTVRGKVAMQRYGCAGCHVISGLSGASGQVGPDLTDIAKRSTLAGRFANDPATMIAWLQHPQAMAPGSGMPEQAVSRADARDMAAYLYGTY